MSPKLTNSNQVTQCDVGKALANLKLPGVGALSQSTICRYSLVDHLLQNLTLPRLTGIKSSITFAGFDKLIDCCT